MIRTDLAYRKTAAVGDGGIGLLIALFDTLAGDLRRAAIAERDGDLEKRCNEARHALLVIGYLEDAVTRGVEGELAQKLALFYRLTRRRILEAQAKRSARALEDAMAEVLNVRELWQRIGDNAPPPEASLPARMPGFSGVTESYAERSENNWAA